MLCWFRDVEKRERENEYEGSTNYIYSRIPGRWMKPSPSIYRNSHMIIIRLFFLADTVDTVSMKETIPPYINYFRVA